MDATLPAIGDLCRMDVAGDTLFLVIDVVNDDVLAQQLGNGQLFWATYSNFEVVK